MTEVAAAVVRCADADAGREGIAPLLAAYQTQLAERDTKIAAQGATIAELTQQVQWLQAQFRLAQQRHFGASSEASPQLPLFDEAEQTAAEAGPTPSASNPVPVKAHTRRQRTRIALSPDLPHEEVTYDLADADKVCPHDGTPLVAIGSEDTEQVEYRPARLKVVRHHRLKYACPHCHQHVVTASRPKPPIPKSVAGASLLAGIAAHKYADGLPLYRQVAMFERIGITLDRTNLARWMIQAGRLVQPLINLLGDQWATQPVVHMDETPVQVLHEPDKPAQSESWMWVRASGGECPVRLFDYAPTRRKTVPLDLLSADTHVLMVDGYGGYAEACRRYGILRLGCWMHARRKFVDAQRLQPKGKTGKADQALAFIAKLYQVESSCRTGPPEPRYQARQEQAKPILDQLHAWLDKTLRTTPPKTTLGVALGYLQHQWPSLIRYIDDGRFPIDNGLAENAIRPFAVGRRNWLFSDTQAGARASANLYSLVETAKANGLNPQRYLERVFADLPNVKTVADYEALLPWHVADLALETSPAD